MQQTPDRNQYRVYCREPAVSRLYASLGLGYNAPNTVDDADFAQDPRHKRPVGHARLNPADAGEHQPLQCHLL